MNRRTRQRQGRDFPPFSILEYLNLNRAQQSVQDENEAVRRDSIMNGRKLSIQENLERFKTEAEERAEPVDGREPPELSI